MRRETMRRIDRVTDQLAGQQLGAVVRGLKARLETADYVRGHISRSTEDGCRWLRHHGDDRGLVRTLVAKARQAAAGGRPRVAKLFADLAGVSFALRKPAHWLCPFSSRPVG